MAINPNPTSYNLTITAKPYGKIIIRFVFGSPGVHQGNPHGVRLCGF